MTVFMEAGGNRDLLLRSSPQCCIRNAADLCIIKLRTGLCTQSNKDTHRSIFDSASPNPFLKSNHLVGNSNYVAEQQSSRCSERQCSLSWQPWYTTTRLNTPLQRPVRHLSHNLNQRRHAVTAMPLLFAERWLTCDVGRLGEELWDLAGVTMLSNGH